MNDQVVFCSINSGLFIENVGFYSLWADEMIDNKFLNVKIGNKELSKLRVSVCNELSKTKEFSIESFYFKLRELVADIDNAKKMEEKLVRDYYVVNFLTVSYLKKSLSEKKRVVLINDSGWSDDFIKCLLVGIDLKWCLDNFELYHYQSMRAQFFDFDELLNAGDSGVYIGIHDPLQASGKNRILPSFHMLSGYLEYERQLVYKDSDLAFTQIRHAWTQAGKLLDENENDAAFRYGFGIVAPLVITYAEWLLQTAIEKQVNQIFPLMRDGYLVNEVLNRIKNYRHLNTIKIKPLYVSRKALYYWDKKKGIEDNFNEEIKLNPTKTIGGLFYSLGLKADHSIDNNIILKNIKDITVNEKVSLYEYLLKYFENHESIIYSAQFDREKIIFEYLNSEIDIQEPFITADLGFAGTIAKKIDGILNDYAENIQQAAFLLCGSSRQTDIVMSGTKVDALLYDFGYESDAFINSTFVYSIIENLCMNAEGTTIAYEHTKSGIEPILNQMTAIDGNLNEKVHQGVLCYLHIWLETWKISPNICKLLLKEKDFLTVILERAILYPTHEEAKLLGNIQTDNEIVGKDFQGVIIDNQVLNDIKNFDDDYMMKEYKNKSHWYSGAYAQKYSGGVYLRVIKDKAHKNMHIRFALNKAEFIYKKGIKSVVIYGVGTKGILLYKMLNEMNIKTLFFVDRGSHLQGMSLHDVEIKQLDSIVCMDNETYVVIASSIYYNEIKENIKRKGLDNDKII